MTKKHVIELTPEERTQLEQMTRTGMTSAARQRHARILLKADISEAGPGWSDLAIAEALEVGVATVERVRRRWAMQGLESALQRKPRCGTSRRKLDGVQEAQLAAIACSVPPEGAERWTLALLADKLVELEIVDSIARDTVRVTLKKTRSSLG